MPDISRRRFLRNASLGAAAVGSVAVVGTSVVSPSLFTSAAGAPKRTGSNDHAESNENVVAHVVDAKSGTIAVFVGTRKIEFQSHDLTRQLIAVTQ